jgi:CHAD domain-containing protein
LNVAQRHALRIAIKRQRYAVEFFQYLFAGRKQARYQQALQEIQDNLGYANDILVAQRLMTITLANTGLMGQYVLGWLAGSQTAGSTGQIAKQLQNLVKSPPCW